MNKTSLDSFDIYELGHTIQLVGAIYADTEKAFLVLLPTESLDGKDVSQLPLTKEEWDRFLKQTDFLETEVITKSADGKVAKAILRKSQRQVDQGTQWRVWKRAGYRCEYCGRDDRPLTVDHLVTWETGGPTTEENLASACAPCNRARGKMEYSEWIESHFYRKVSAGLSAAQRQHNQAVVGRLGNIPRVIHKKSR